MQHLNGAVESSQLHIAAIPEVYDLLSRVLYTQPGPRFFPLKLTMMSASLHKPLVV